MGMSHDSFLELISTYEKGSEGIHNPKTGARLAAVVPMHTLGRLVGLDELTRTARSLGIAVVEDAAEALGSFKDGYHSGSTDTSILSFNGNKTITTGGGGAILANNEEDATKAKHLSTTARLKHNWEFKHDQIGFNYRMPNTIAAIAYAQLEDVDFVIQRKIEIAQYYGGKLAGIDEIQLPIEREYAKNVYWMYHIVLKNGAKGKREHVMKYLFEEGVETRVSFTPLNQQKVYIEKYAYDPASCPVANLVGENGFYLPSGPLLTQIQQDYVISQLKNALYS
jgi:perosamine synthetase